MQAKTIDRRWAEAQSLWPSLRDSFGAEFGVTPILGLSFLATSLARNRIVRLHRV